VTFVVKKSLLNYPYLGPVLASREPLAIGRTNPREDFMTVMEGGKKHLSQGRSVIIFPQGSRKPIVEETDFNTLGVKLARKAGVPIIPIALKTDVWGEGTIIKDIG
jgi:1-acyl-sn-glycerol-3-phosphate acyltransferase